MSSTTGIKRAAVGSSVAAEKTRGILALVAVAAGLWLFDLVQLVAH